MKYRQLERRDRVRIASLKRTCSAAEIARRTGFHRSTISRELKRNGGLWDRGDTCHWAYDNVSAQRFANFRRRKANQKRVRILHSTQKWVIQLLKKSWSPQQIAGCSSRLGPQKISHESVYQIILRDKKQGGKLYRKLKRFGKRKRRIAERVYEREIIPQRIDIRERPSIVGTRKRLGDLEGDLIVGKNQKSYILTLVDRKSRQIAIEKLRRRDKPSVEAAFLRALSRFPVVQTLTLDNAREFSCHTEVTAKTLIAIYFATPYTSQERGSIENANGMLRHYLPKRTDFRPIKDEKLLALECDLNNRPRKVLGYFTPLEIVRKELLKSFNPYKNLVALRT